MARPGVQGGRAPHSKDVCQAGKLARKSATLHRDVGRSGHPRARKERREQGRLLARPESPGSGGAAAAAQNRLDQARKYQATAGAPRSRK